MKFCFNTSFTIPKQSQRSISILQDGSRFLALFWMDKNPSYNRRNRLNAVGMVNSLDFDLFAQSCLSQVLGVLWYLTYWNRGK